MILPPARPALPPHPGPYRQQQRSLADMANEQLRRGAPRDPLAQGMEAAGRDDCLHAPKPNAPAGGLLALPQLAERALNEKCAR
ncbi:MAG: hypothetical protein AB7E83_12750 [Ramlibacter sp.]